MAPEKIVPILLAAGSSERLGFPKPLAKFGRKTALAIAAGNCAGLGRPVVVLGCDAAKIRPKVPRGVQTVVNRRWRKGQSSSLVCALEHVPRNAAFLLYPVDQPLLERKTIWQLVRAFRMRGGGEEIVMPRHKRRDGHPVIVAASLRRELERAKTAREVLYRKPRRILIVNVRTRAIIEDFNTLESYRACLRKYLARRKRTHRARTSL